MITDTELIDRFNYWLNHYTKNSDRHYHDTPDWKIQDIYYDFIVERVLNEIPEEYGTDEEIIERLNNLI